jgi:hypothetical protein
MSDERAWVVTGSCGSCTFLASSSHTALRWRACWTSLAESPILSTPAFSASLMGGGSFLLPPMRAGALGGVGLLMVMMMMSSG